ncbi:MULTISPECIES: glucokinase [Alphaproteobacteria]|uniref:Glucokinase n=2 Tax=Alphaproteobacteria TaxID=28211 RepID=A0A512HIW8_9HYPH|nr:MULTISPECIES: glucokinase [Alphaproteobacteria]GEO85393.1 glucokinase [Ciceribacter naphthalenivorans]GLR21032.1 glucokinase [Ciceribacter naphthalenivorans]GLT03888.1 glucokinase [Sphingomonas psychrolutea]
MPKPIDNDKLTFPILIGDIGGTNARFSILIDAYAEPRQFPIAHTADFATIDEAIQVTVLDKTSVQPRSAILAIAGPIKGDEIPLTNCDWVVRPKALIADLGFAEVLLVNDFEAQALAVASLAEKDRAPIGANNVSPIASRVVLGPGTGLGVAGLVHAQHTWFPVPGEGGHVDIGPRSERDFAIFPNLTPIEGRISAEQLLCGRGIVNIYHAVCATDGIEPKFTLPADITATALSGADTQAVETISLFVTYLGRLAGDMALIFMARGGVFLSGGISQKIIPALKRPEFRQGFEDKAPHTALMKTIPTFVVTHPLAALSGLAAFARTPANFGLATEGRRWRG